MEDFTIKCQNNFENQILNAQNLNKSQNKPQKVQMFIQSPLIPVFDAVEGIKFDFNDGIRIYFPQNEKIYRCVFSDLDSGIILYSNDTTPGCTITSVSKFYIRFKLDIYEKDKFDAPIFTHEFDCKDKDVLVQIPDGALGDAIAWFSYCEKFMQKTSCNLYVMIPQRFIDLFKDQYPKINFVVRDKAIELNSYASYRLGLYFRGNTSHQPYDFREVGLHKTVGYILGLRGNELDEIAPRLNLTSERTIKQKYVVIATHSSSHCKMWNNPSGWRQVIKYLKDKGYRVLCIDKMTEYGQGQVWHHIPNGCEDFTGDRPLQERIDLISHADMFIGLSSGLSWVAWCCKVPVIMISGFTNPWNEFYTKYRVINEQVCHGCWNDMRCEFEHENFLWCPRKEKNVDKFECSKMISSLQVIKKIDEVIEDFNL